LSVINPKASNLAERILVGPDAETGIAYFFPWPQRIASVSDPATAADRIERVLAEVGR
jgi:hypothetical protein